MESNRINILDIDILRLDIQIISNNILIHLIYKKDRFNKSDYIRMLHIWEEVLNTFQSKGIYEVFSLVENDKKLLKFQRMFGMVELLEFEDKTLFRRFTHGS